MAGASPAAMPHRIEPLPEPEHPTTRVCRPRIGSTHAVPSCRRPTLSASTSTRDGTVPSRAVRSTSRITSSMTSTPGQAGRVRQATAPAAVPIAGAAASRCSTVCPTRADTCNLNVSPRVQARCSLGCTHTFSAFLPCSRNTDRPHSRASTGQARRAHRRHRHRRDGPAMSRSNERGQAVAHTPNTTAGTTRAATADDDQPPRIDLAGRRHHQQQHQGVAPVPHRPAPDPRHHPHRAHPLTRPASAGGGSVQFTVTVTPPSVPVLIAYRPSR